ncbi:MAG: sel1 repeat family protein [Candidatus Adiutrix sp.]|jgi:TPR repeat protein|nr:sel1 repeat family protein [Candidatus Adiutrix sp.]
MSDFTNLMDAANNGGVEAQAQLGFLFFKGSKETSQDNVQAALWFQKAAEQGHARAQFQLADMYFKALGVTKDEGKAVEWILKAAESGHAVAQSKLSVFYANGAFGLPQDKAKAEYWGNKAKFGAR